MPSDAIPRLNAALEGRYRIERELGEGGMATVYLADDLRHDRKVAIKVLRPELAALMGAERFLAEIKTTANLQHPHVLPLHDSGEADGFLFYVMPYVEGESLRDRLDREKQLPVEDAVGIATKVAGALHAAHGRGVIHRDIKPANILLGQGGEPLVADFGIALAVQEAGGGRLTETGLSLGTPYYMSPEQATADRDPDARSDVYALACVLFEMLAGDPPHTASTAQATIAKILTEDAPAVSQHRKSVPANVVSAIARGLQKVPADRFATAADFGQALSDPGYRWGPGGEERVATSRGRAQWAMAALVSVAALALGALLGRSLGSGEAVVTPPSFHVTLDPELPATGTVGVTVALDGTVIYQDDPRGDQTGVFGMPFVARRPGAVDPTVLMGTSGGIDGAVSPDGRWFAYRDDAQNRIARISTDGGSPIGIRSFGWGAGAEENHGVFWPLAWSGDDWIYGTLFEMAAGVTGSSYLARLRASDGAMEELVTTQPGVTVSGVEVLPGDRTIVFDVASDEETPDPRILALDVATRDTTFIADGHGAQWSPSGHLIYSDGGPLFALPFDPDAGVPTGAAFSLGLDLGPPPRLRWPRLFHVSASGSMAYVLGAGDWGAASSVFFASGDSLERIPVRQNVGRQHYTVSPDGEEIVYTDRARVVVQNLRTNAIDELPLTRGPINQPRGLAWSRNGEALALGDAEESVLHLRTNQAGQQSLTSIQLESGFAQPTDWLDADRVLASWSPMSDRDAQSDIVIIDRRTGAIEPLLSGEWTEGEARIAPSGRWIAYETMQGGVRRLVVRSFPTLGSEVEVTRDSSPLGTWYSIGPYWDHRGDTIYYWEDGGVWRVSVADGPAGPRLVDRTREVTLDDDDQLFGVHPDGRPLVGLFFEEVGPPPRLMLITDLASEIRALENGR